MKMMTFELAILSVLFGISTFGMVTSNHLNYTYRFDVYPLEKCPKNAHEFETAAKRKNCTGNSRYLCAPDKYLSNLIEFCTDRPVSLFKNGHCVRLEGTGDLNHYRCEDKFQRGCPTEPYTDEEIYKYPACLEINVRFHCFSADKDCPERLDKYVSDDFKKEESINTTNTEKSDGSIKSHGAIVIFVVYVIMVTTVTGIIAFFVIKQRNKKAPLQQHVPPTQDTDENEKIVQENKKSCLKDKEAMRYTSLSGDKEGEISLKGVKTILDVRDKLAKKLNVLRDTLYVVNKECGMLLEDDKEIKDFPADTLDLMIVLDENRMKQTHDGGSKSDTDDDSEDDDEDEDNDVNEGEGSLLGCKHCKNFKGSWFKWTRQQLLDKRNCSLKCEACGSTLDFDKIVKQCKMTPDEHKFFQTVLSVNRFNRHIAAQLAVADFSFIS